MRVRKYRYFTADFETTVYEGQVFTEVWASAIVELFHREVEINNSIEGFFDTLLKKDGNLMVYFHNLKFDGSFILCYFFTKTQYNQALIKKDNEIRFAREFEMKNNDFTYSISDKGLFYEIILKEKNRYIVFRDSLKLLPMSVKYIGESFNNEFTKSTIEYKGRRKSGGVISETEKDYIKRDVLVMCEALEIMFSDGHNKLTIGSCCLSEFKANYDSNMYEDYFPQLNYEYGTYNVDAYIRKSYNGGWCYVNPKYKQKIATKGITMDVNSLYPFVMHSDSNNRYPIGKPTFWNGNYIPELDVTKYFFVRLKCRFILKDGFLPFIHIKNSPFYDPHENLVSSDPTYKNKRVRKIKTEYIEQTGLVELTLTQTDYYLFLKHYHVFDLEIIDGCYFETRIGLFDIYLNKYRKIKENSTGAKRIIAKLFSNNLYGKMAKSKCASFKIARANEYGVLKYVTIEKNDSKLGYIPIGSAITSYARCYTITAAQNNIEHFCYSDTDSIHCACDSSDLKSISVGDKQYGLWKEELKWDLAFFSRQKTYIEIADNCFNICCAGMPFRCKMLFAKSCGFDYIFQNGIKTKIEFDKLSDEEKDFLKVKRKISDLTIGLKVPSKLQLTNISGGVVLKEVDYVMHK